MPLNSDYLSSTLSILKKCTFEIMKKAQLTLEQKVRILILKEGQQRSVTDIHEKTGIPRSTIYSFLNSYAEKGKLEAGLLRLATRRSSAT